MPHRNAPLTETGRLRLARCIVDDGWSLRRAAERFQVSHTTAARWASRYRQHGPAARGACFSEVSPSVCGNSNLVKIHFSANTEKGSDQGICQP